jgi:hypothetical protein
LKLGALLGLSILVLSTFGHADTAWREVFCVGGDAIDSADLSVTCDPKEDIVQLTLETGAADNEKDELKRTYTAHLAAGFFHQMYRKGRIELVLSSEKSNVFGGETTKAALVDLVKNGKDGFKGFIALDGSVYEVECPKDPTKVWGKSH